MIQTWLDLPTFGVFAVLALLYGATAAIISTFVFSRAAKPLPRRIDGLTPAYFGAISVLFALLTGFLASDIGDRNRQATRAVQTEAGELRNIFTLSVASASDMRAIRAAWRTYVTGVLNDDWPQMAKGGHSDAVDHAYDALLREISDPKIAAAAGVPIQAALLASAVRVSTARSDRIALASDRTNDLKWMMVLLLGVMTQIAIGMVHLKKRGPNVAALGVFSLAVVIALGFIALQESPFEGPIDISPAPLQDLLKLQAPNG